MKQVCKIPSGPTYVNECDGSPKDGYPLRMDASRTNEGEKAHERAEARERKVRKRESDESRDAHSTSKRHPEENRADAQFS